MPNIVLFQATVAKYFANTRHRRIIKNMKAIETFVFFDLETTGLPNKNTMPKITELAMVAVSRAAICNSNGDLPRVKHKLVMPFNPLITLSTKAQEMSGLCNKNLDSVQSFSQSTNKLLGNFLEQLTSPVCLVAHNGDKFDYPVFREELKRSGTLTIGSEIHTIDSLQFFRDFFGKNQDLLQKKSDLNVINHAGEPDVNILLEDGNDLLLSNAMDQFIFESFNSENAWGTDIDNSNACPPKELTETLAMSCCQTMQRINEKTPEGQIIRYQRSDKNFQDEEARAVRRRLDFANNAIPNFRLGTIYHHIFGVPSKDNHTAEGDCLTLLQCVLRLGTFFIEWADCNAVRFIAK